MKCPKCKKGRAMVVDSRPYRNGAAIARRRECFDCGYKFTTCEIPYEFKIGRPKNERPDSKT